MNLLFFFRPELVDVSEIESKDNKTNLETAFDLAEKHLKVPKLLEVEGTCALIFVIMCKAEATTSKICNCFLNYSALK